MVKASCLLIVHSQVVSEGQHDICGRIEVAGATELTPLKPANASLAVGGGGLLRGLYGVRIQVGTLGNLAEAGFVFETA
ncbi:hypothetical protein D9M69_666320 [compost metagenome]